MRENKSTFYSHYLSTDCDLRLGTRRRTPWGPAESVSAFVGSPLGATRSNSLFSSWTQGDQRFLCKQFSVASTVVEAHLRNKSPISSSSSRYFSNRAW